MLSGQALTSALPLGDGLVLVDVGGAARSAAVHVGGGWASFVFGAGEEPNQPDRRGGEAPFGGKGSRGAGTRRSTHGAGSPHEQRRHRERQTRLCDGSCGTGSRRRLRGIVMRATVVD
jgi:hypothetical protein